MCMFIYIHTHTCIYTVICALFSSNLFSLITLSCNVSNSSEESFSGCYDFLVHIRYGYVTTPPKRPSCKRHWTEGYVELCAQAQTAGYTDLSKERGVV